ncbi:MAG: AAA family ATPase [Pseudoruegeria sp.]
MTTLSIKTSDNESLTTELGNGDVLYVLGANGTGKSTLLFEWARSNPGSKLIAGNRDITFSSAGVEISAAQAVQNEKNSTQFIRQTATRYKRRTHNNDNWLNALIFLLKSKGDYLYRRYQKADIADRPDEKKQALENQPEDLINNAFRVANLPLILEWNEKSQLIATKQGVSEPFGHNEMSDGERSALILTASAILADKNGTILIDEPERHLHRSISAPLLAYLKEIRKDLKWVISTHDLTLPADDPDAKILALYGYDGATWTADLLDNDGTLDPAISAAIYGARQKVLFIEGNRSTSLDLPLYNLLFPEVTIIPVGTCKDVLQAVKGLKNIETIHHMIPRGLIDSDNRADLEKLEQEGVFALKVYAIESLYFHPIVIQAVLKGAGTNLTLVTVTEKACSSINDGNIKKMAQDKAYREMKANVEKQVPTQSAFLDTDENWTIEIPNSSIRISEIETEIRSFVEDHNWKGLLKSVKIKDTAAPGKIAKSLGYKNVDSYQIAAKKSLRDKPDILTQLKKFASVSFD